ncbi:MAG: SUMF1/EgtB/PvdO family nonheme iron enzyme [Deltaproteobacteria bacterium]|nr:SUMF1/EgtB/PvdO family nonheme iron enzyme [Deltaproteobacteria bacterium]
MFQQPGTDKKYFLGQVSLSSNRVKRGGRWNNNARNVRASNRNNNTPDNRNNNLGFRLAAQFGGRTRCVQATQRQSFQTVQTSVLHGYNPLTPFVKGE